MTEAVTDAVKNVEKRIENALTVLWDDLPSWQQDNHYIHSGYRPASESFGKSFASLGYLHNESVNIYSHLLGALLFSGAGFVLYTALKPRYETATPSDVMAFGCFFAGAAACLGMSATYHAISNHSPIVARYGNKLDYVGIVFLITGSFIPSIFYGFYCHPHLKEFYWTMVCSLKLSPTRTDSFSDMLSWTWMCFGVRIRPIQNSSVATIPSRNVRGNGIIRSLSNPPWSENVRNRRHEKSNWSFVASTARIHVHLGGWTLRCK